jgi:hypothetical protein
VDRKNERLIFPYPGGPSTNKPGGDWDGAGITSSVTTRRNSKIDLGAYQIRGPGLTMNRESFREYFHQKYCIKILK